MKISELITILEAPNANHIEIESLIGALRKFEDRPVKMFTEKVRKMKFPKVDPEKAAAALTEVFQNSLAFEEKLKEMQSSRDYTKPVFQLVFEKLFPSSKPPSKSIKRADLIEKIRKERRREENWATA